MAFYSDEQLRKIEEARSTVQARFDSLLVDFLLHEFADVAARDHAMEGYCRRLGILVRCIDNVFTAIPADWPRPPTDNEIQNCNINIHAFVINVFGSLDNLAWIWVAERPVKQADGRPLGKHQVSLRSKLVFPTLPDVLQRDLTSYQRWFDGMEAYRDTLAHRIPLYIPPYTIRASDAAAYNQLESDMVMARRRRNREQYDRLADRQKALGRFLPIMKHSPARDFTPGYHYFHSQLLADFATVESIGRRILDGVVALRA